MVKALRNFFYWSLNYQVFCLLMVMTPAKSLYSQESFCKFFAPSDSFHRQRFELAVTGASITYTVFATGLYSAWYRQQGLGKFHFFNDWNEWMLMDKLGHSYSSYIQSELLYSGCQWTGMKKKNALLWSIGTSLLFQHTIEIMDGFGKGYGFSWSDVGANFLGSGCFALQQGLWNEQRFRIRYSAHLEDYSKDNPILPQRAEYLYGHGALQRILKDYNGQTYWLSFHPTLAWGIEQDFWPSWLELSIGFGAKNLYGARSNDWVDSMGTHREAGPAYPRTNQYYLSLDINFRKIPVRNAFWRSIIHTVGIFKIPAPALEFNSPGSVRWNWLAF